MDLDVPPLRSERSLITERIKKLSASTSQAIPHARHIQLPEESKSLIAKACQTP